MSPQDFEKAMFARAVWRLAKSNDVNEIAAIACTLRNHVTPRPGQPQTFKSFTDAAEGFMSVYPLRAEPKLSEPAFVSHPDGLLAIIDSVYDFSYPDITASQTTPGARYFGQAANLPEWLQAVAVTRQLIGTFGAQQFFS